MVAQPSSARRFSTELGENAIRFNDDILIAPAIGKEEGAPLSAYTTFLRAGAQADLPAPYTELWVVLTGALRVGEAGAAVTVRAGDFVHVPEQAPGRVEALEDTTMVCVSAPAH
ncbi:cupin domain-containing protein [Microlunatus sp. GCM10028923]|uniref:cupin domain-containing protein n=1 Tax=Microlunatus sp. GCM10028923 TaxID=3273400 RepID=UPI00361339C5